MIVKMKAKSFRRVRAIFAAFAVIVIMAVIGYALGSFGADWMRESKFQKERQNKKDFALARLERFVRVGNHLPDHEFHNINGGTSLLSDIIGPRKVIAYLRIGCGSCRLELEYFKEATTQCGNQSFFVIISDSDPEKLLEMRTEFSLTCPVLYDMGSAFKEKLGICVFPFNLIVDDSLKIRDMIVSYIRSDEFVEINRLNGDNQH